MESKEHTRVRWMVLRCVAPSVGVRSCRISPSWRVSEKREMPSVDRISASQMVGWGAPISPPVDVHAMSRRVTFFWMENRQVISALSGCVAR